MSDAPTIQPGATPPHLITLVLLTGVSVLTLNMFLPSLPAMTRDFATTEAMMALAVSGYMLAAAGMQLVLGPVSDRVGRRPVLLCALTLYTLASLGCWMAQGIETFILCRFAQSVVIGGAVLSSAAIRDLWPPQEAAARLGTVGAAMALAPMLGPTLGGLLDVWLGWRATFALFTLLGAGLLALSLMDFGETRPQEQAPTRLEGYLALLRAPQFWAFALTMAFSVGAFYIFVTGVPYVAANQFHLSSALTGAGIGSITAGFMVGAALTARYTTRFGLTPMILAGRVAGLCGVCSALGLFAVGIVHPLTLFAGVMFVGFGNGLTMANGYSGAMSVKPALAGTAAGLAGALGIAIGAGLTALSLTFLQSEATAARLLTLMLGSICLSLVFALFAHRGRQAEQG